MARQKKQLDADAVLGAFRRGETMYEIAARLQVHPREIRRVLEAHNVNWRVKSAFPHLAGFVDPARAVGAAVLAYAAIDYRDGALSATWLDSRECEGWAEIAGVSREWIKRRLLEER